MTTATEEKKFDCKSCSDTHRVWSPDRCQWLLCTSCPQPCERCWLVGFEKLRYPGGAYCAKNPCKCKCHGRRFFTLDEAKALKAGDIVEVLNEPNGTWFKAKVVDSPKAHCPTWVSVKAKTIEDDKTVFGIAYEDGSVFSSLRKVDNELR